MGVFTLNHETYNEKPVWGSHNNSQQIYNNGVGKNSTNYSSFPLLNFFVHFDITFKCQMVVG
jgi:hypothetical protein